MNNTQYRMLSPVLLLLTVCTIYVAGHSNSTEQYDGHGRISVFWTGFEAEDSTARLLKLVGLVCVVTLTLSLVCCCLCSFRKSKRSRKWVLVERVGLVDGDFISEQHDNHGLQMTDFRDERKQLAL